MKLPWIPTHAVRAQGRLLSLAFKARHNPSPSHCLTVFPPCPELLCSHQPSDLPFCVCCSSFLGYPPAVSSPQRSDSFCETANSKTLPGEALSDPPRQCQTLTPLGSHILGLLTPESVNSLTSQAQIWELMCKGSVLTIHL